MNPNLNHPARKAYEQRVCEHFEASFADEFYRDEKHPRLDGCLANVPPAVLAPADNRRPAAGWHRRDTELDDSLGLALDMFAVAMAILAGVAFAVVVTVMMWRAHPVLNIALIALVGLWAAARYLPLPGTRGEGRS